MSEKRKLSPVLSHTVEIALFAMLGVITYISKTLMEGFPNMHLVAVLTVTYTVVFRWKALIPIYVYAFLVLQNYGFQFTWWLPNLYIWTVLWAVTMLLPKNMPKPVAGVVYCVVCSLHGFLYGTLWAPAQAVIFGLDLRGMLTWIAAGFGYDAVHGVSNLLLGTLVVPLAEALRRAVKSIR